MLLQIHTNKGDEDKDDNDEYGMITRFDGYIVSIVIIAVKRRSAREGLNENDDNDDDCNDETQNQ